MSSVGLLNIWSYISFKWGSKTRIQIHKSKGNVMQKQKYLNYQSWWTKLGLIDFLPVVLSYRREREILSWATMDWHSKMLHISLICQLAHVQVSASPSHFGSEQQILWQMKFYTTTPSGQCELELNESAVAARMKSLWVKHFWMMVI